MEKYKLREGEKYIDEYVDNEGKPVIIFEDTKGEIKHGWILEINEKTIVMIEQAAAEEGISVEDFIDRAVEEMILKLIDEDEKRQFIEEISD